MVQNIINATKRGWVGERWMESMRLWLLDLGLPEMAKLFKRRIPSQFSVACPNKKIIHMNMNNMNMNMEKWVAFASH